MLNIQSSPAERKFRVRRLFRLFPLGWAVAALALTLSACVQRETRVTAYCPDTLSYRAKASLREILRSLEARQFTAADEQEGRGLEGDWPQFVGVRGPLIPFTRTFRERSPFIPSFTHDCLTAINDSCGLTPGEVQKVGTMRLRALEMMRRFQIATPPGCAGAFGYWMPGIRHGRILEPVTRPLTSFLVRGPEFGGFLVADYAQSLMPSKFWIWPDTDDTAVVLAAWAKERRRQPSLVTTPPDLSRLFSRHRDVIPVPGRWPEWLPANSRAFRTYIVTPDQFERLPLAEVDAIVNANVLFALGLAGRLDTPGATEAVRLINRMTSQGLHATPSQVSLYYKEGLLGHYIILRAWREGCIRELAPSAQRLKHHIESLAQRHTDGSVIWDLGHPKFDTALAVLSLQLAGGSPDSIRRGIHGLLRMKADSSSVRENAPLYFGTTEGGLVFSWYSEAATDSFIAAALARYLHSAH